MPPAELCVVGDADQSIYAFRGATIRNILDFEQDYPDATTILLEQNYRSTQTILSAANAVIARNASRKPKNLWTDAGEGEPIVGYVADNEHDEAAFVAGEVDRLTDEEGVSPSQVAVFYRTNAQSRVFEEVFIRVGLPYKVVGGVRFYERREVRDALAYLRLLANPEDTVSLRRILNVPKRGIGDRAEACLEALAQREAHLLRRGACGAARTPTGWRPGRWPPCRRFRTAGRRPAAPSSRPGRGRRPCSRRSWSAPATRRAGRLGRPAGPDPAGEPAGAGVGGPGVRGGAAADGAVRVAADFLEQVALVADADQIPDEPEEGAEAAAAGVVTLMTLHTAKGLEFPVVFLTGLEDGVFPHLRSLGDPTELEEERRLAYVGITRAQERLYLSRSAVRSAWGAPQAQPGLALPRGGPRPSWSTGAARSRR